MTDDAEAQEDEMTALRSILIDDDDDGDDRGEVRAEDAAVVLERIEGSGLWHGRISVAAEMVRSSAPSCRIKGFFENVTQCYILAGKNGDCYNSGGVIFGVAPPASGIDLLTATRLSVRDPSRIQTRVSVDDRGTGKSRRRHETDKFAICLQQCTNVKKRHNCHLFL